MVSKKAKEKNMPHHCCGKGWLIAKGLIALVLGVSLWMAYVGLEQVFAIILILVGLGKLYHSCC